jgi:hypothetical protein
MFGTMGGGSLRKQSKDLLYYLQHPDELDAKVERHERYHWLPCRRIGSSLLHIPAGPDPCSTRCANFSWRAATSRIVSSASVSYMVSALAKISRARARKSLASDRRLTSTIGKLSPRE